MRTGKNRAFTLIELLIVIGIIGFLATLAMAARGSAQAKARDNKRAGDLSQIQKALGVGHGLTGVYPNGATTENLGRDANSKTICIKNSVLDFTATTAAANCDQDKIFMGLIPADPLAAQNYVYKSTSAAPYNSGQYYCIQTTFEKGLEKTPAGPVKIDSEGALKSGTCP
jgi:prepilin-type N-terminal cleavage/methylation domain-containing protein